jgi:hypothetical protein
MRPASSEANLPFGQSSTAASFCLAFVAIPLFGCPSCGLPACDRRLLARPHRAQRHPEAPHFERVDVFNDGGAGTFLLAVAWMLWKGGPFRTEAYAFSGKGCAALATDNPMISKIGIGALISELPVPASISGTHIDHGSTGTATTGQEESARPRRSS